MACLKELKYIWTKTEISTAELGLDRTNAYDLVKTPA